jgi:hypothetical protein
MVLRRIFEPKRDEVTGEWRMECYTLEDGHVGRNM